MDMKLSKYYSILSWSMLMRDSSDVESCVILLSFRQLSSTSLPLESFLYWSQYALVIWLRITSTLFRFSIQEPSFILFPIINFAVENQGYWLGTFILKVVRIQPISNHVLQIFIDERSTICVNEFISWCRDFIRDNLLEPSPSIPFFCPYNKFVSCPHTSLIFRKPPFVLEFSEHTLR